MFQAAADVVDAGYRLLRSPGAEEKLQGNHAVLQAKLRNLEAALADHPLAAQSRSQAFAPSPALTPASFRRSPVLGVALADDAVILIILLLAAAAVASPLARSASLRPRSHIKMFLNPWKKSWRLRQG